MNPGRAVPDTLGGMFPALAIGLVAGVLSGMFGVGGGFLIVPALVAFVHLDQRVASGTSLVAVIPISVAALVGYAGEGKVDLFVAMLLVAGGLIGAEVGTRLLNRLPIRTLQLAFAGVLVLAALRLILGGSPGSGATTLGPTRDAGLVALGLGTGMLSGLLGVGGGFVMVPGMLVIASMPSALARGTSLAAIVPTALFATVRNLRNANADLRVGLTVGVAGALSASLTSRVAVGLDPVLSNRLLGVLLVVLAVKMVIDARRRGARPGAAVRSTAGTT